VCVGVRECVCGRVEGEVPKEMELPLVLI